MTVAFHDGESWDIKQGAPAGPDFDMRIPSSREGHGPYRIVRSQCAGYLIHQPRCEAWVHGHRLCRHVREAVYRAEQPANDFMDSVQALRLSGNWWADPRTFGEKVITLLDDARHQREALEKAWERDEAEREQATKPLAQRADEAIAQFGSWS